jgi:hypothetical protein
MKLVLDDGEIVAYRVGMNITFVLDSEKKKKHKSKDQEDEEEDDEEETAQVSPESPLISISPARA